MNQPPLNPDALSDTARVALINSARELGQEHLCLSVPAQAKKVLNDCADALAVAQPVVNSVEELNALPVGSVILDGDPCVLQMVEKSSIVGSAWAIANVELIYMAGKITLPARVLYRPEVES